MSDSGTQWKSVFTSEFRCFAREWGFRHETSSPRFAQCNATCERFSPAELVMERRIGTALPTTAEQLEPRIPDPAFIQEKEDHWKIKKNFGSWTNIVPGSFQEEPRSYIIETEKGELGRNRFHLIPMAESEVALSATTETEATQETVQTTVPETLVTTESVQPETPVTVTQTQRQLQTCCLNSQS